MNIEFRFDNMTIGKFNSEKEYIDYYVKDHNKKNPGSGEKWSQEWNTNTREKYPQVFIDQINTKTSKRGMNFSQKNSDATYTMIVKTVQVSQLMGARNSFAEKQEVKLVMEISIVETKNPNNEIAKISVTKISGTGYGLPMCMQDAFSSAGLETGAFITKQLNNKK